jgi:hypothetical protein
VHAGQKDLVKVDDNCAMIVGNPKGILGQQLRPHSLDINIFKFITC